MTQAREYRWAKQDANKGEETKDYSLQFQSELRIDIETSK